jgi:colicin import membrane protein
VTSNSFDRDFNKSFAMSLLGHGLLFLLFFIGGEVVTKAFKSSSNDVEIIRSAVRVDVVGMPKFTVQELKKMEANPVIEKAPEVVQGKKEETVTESDDVIKKDDLVIQEEGKKKANFLNMLSDYSNKKVAPKAQKKGEKTGAPAAENKKLDSLILEGNRLSQGSALVGDYSDEQNSAFSAYVQNLPGVIRPFWKLPSYLLEKDLRCRIKIYLSSSGKLIKLELQESSGVAEFDARAMNAVREATFPVPSAEVAARLTNSGIILGFPI